MDLSLGAVSKRILQAIINGQQPEEDDLQIIIDDWLKYPDRTERLYDTGLLQFARQLSVARAAVILIDEEDNGD